MIPKIAIVGPESSGKSTLTAELAAYFEEDWVKEYAREYLNQLGRGYVQSDLIEIALGQLQAEEKVLAKNPQILLCDTNLLIIKIWSEFKYGNCDKALQDLFNFSDYELYLLCSPDIPWAFDPQREHPHLRRELFDIYLKELKQADLPFVIIRGNREDRLDVAVSEINQIILAKK